MTSLALYELGAVLTSFVIIAGMGTAPGTELTPGERRVFIGGVVLWPLLLFFVVRALVFPRGKAEQ